MTTGKRGWRRYVTEIAFHDACGRPARSRRLEGSLGTDMVTPAAARKAVTQLVERHGTLAPSAPFGRRVTTARRPTCISKQPTVADDGRLSGASLYSSDAD